MEGYDVVATHDDVSVWGQGGCRIMVNVNYIDEFHRVRIDDGIPIPSLDLIGIPVLDLEACQMEPVPE